MRPTSPRISITLILALLCFVCIACGTPSQKTTSTPARSTATPASTDTREKIANSEPQPSATVAAQPTATAAPVAVLGFSDTADFQGWTLSLARMETYRQIPISPDAPGRAARGRWWLVWLDARNRQDSERPMTWDLVFQLQDATGAVHDELDTIDRDAAASFAGSVERSPFTAPVPADGLTHPILAFDLPANTQPSALLVRQAVERSTWLSYDLSTVVGPALEAAAVVEAKATEVAIAEATEIAAAKAREAAAAAEATQLAGSKVATAEAKAAKQATAAAAQPRLEITYINYDGDQPRTEGDEYAEITNTGGAPINLKGYNLYAGDPGQDFYFPSFVLDAGESTRVYTNAYTDPGEFSFDIGRAIWNNDGDCGYLYDPKGNEVDSYCY